MIKNVIFDLGRVLYNYWPENDLLNLGFSEEKAELFMSRVFDAPIWKEYDRGSFDKNEMLNQLCKDFPDMAEDFNTVFDDRWVDRVITVIPESLEFYYEVKEKGYKIYILTNFPGDNFAHCRARDSFFDEADGIVVSAYEKLNKPDHALFRLLLERYGLKAEETVFIDDMQYNIEAAGELGIHGICFTTLDDCKKRFKEITNEA